MNKEPRQVYLRFNPRCGYSGCPRDGHMLPCISTGLRNMGGQSFFNLCELRPQRFSRVSPCKDFYCQLKVMKDSCFAVKKCFCHRGKYFLKYFENKMSNLFKTTIFFVQNRLFYYPEFISAFLSSYLGLILSLKNPQRQLYHFEFESISMMKLPLFKAEFEIQREIKGLARLH